MRSPVSASWSKRAASQSRSSRRSCAVASAAGPAQTSQRSWLARTGLELGDELTYSIGGQELTVKITSVRRVQWDSFRPNFFMVVNPGLVESYAHTYITSFHVEPEQ